MIPPHSAVFVSFLLPLLGLDAAIFSIRSAFLSLVPSSVSALRVCAFFSFLCVFSQSAAVPVIVPFATWMSPAVQFAFVLMRNQRFASTSCHALIARAVSHGARRRRERARWRAFACCKRRHQRRPKPRRRRFSMPTAAGRTVGGAVEGNRRQRRGRHGGGYGEAAAPGAAAGQPGGEEQWWRGQRRRRSGLVAARWSNEGASRCDGWNPSVAGACGRWGARRRGRSSSCG